MTIHDEIYELANRVGTLLLARNLTCTVAESCTGGALAAAITDIAGSSQWFDRGFVTYSNQAKQHMLAVSAETIAAFGAVSQEVACAMAKGALAASAADVSVAITGIAGPGGGSLLKPVGTVWIAWGNRQNEKDIQCFVFSGNRIKIRQQAVKTALEHLITFIK